MNKVFSTAAEAVADIGNGAVIAVAGFCAAGVPRQLLAALTETKVRDITFTCGVGPLQSVPEIMSRLVSDHRIKKIIDSYPLRTSPEIGKNDPLEQAVRNREIELEVYPMGTLAEKYRAGGAGIPAFYTPTGIGTEVAEHIITNIPENRLPREIRNINGRQCILEYALRPDFALLRADMADTQGNLRFQKTGRNFGPVMAKAARITIVEVDRIVAPGTIAGDDIHLPGIFVQRLVQAPAATCLADYPVIEGEDR